MHIIKRKYAKSESSKRFEVSSEREVANLIVALNALSTAFDTAGVKVECEYRPDDEVVAVFVGTLPEHPVHVGGDSVLAALNDVYTYIWSQV